MPEWRRRKWRKLHADFATSTKLRNVGPHCLALLAAMTSHAWWDEESPEGRMYESEGVPMPLLDVWALAQLTPKQGRLAWGRLTEKRTVGLIAGCPALLNFAEHQKGESAERMRRLRARTSPSPTRHVTRDVTSPVTECRMQSAEVEAEEENPSGSPVVPTGDGHETPANDLPGEESPGLLQHTDPTPKSKPGKRRGKPRADVPPDFVTAAYEAFSDAREDLTGFRPRGLSAEMLDQLAKLYAAHSPSIDDWRLVVRQRLAMDKRGEGYGSLTWVSITAPANFERWLLESQKRGDIRAKPTGRAPVSSHPTKSEIVDLKAAFTNRGENR